MTTPKETPSKVLTVREVAQTLQMPEKTVYDQLSRGTIPGKIKVGACVRVIRSTFERWLDEAQAAS